MAAPFATPLVTEAIRDVLVGDGTLTAMLATFAPGFGTGAAVYSENGVPPKAAFPYVTIGAPTETPFNSMGDADAGGSNCTLQVKGFSKKTADDEVMAIMGRVKSLLDDEDLAVPGYGSAVCEFDIMPDLFVELVGGVLIRQLPMIFRVYVHESA